MEKEKGIPLPNSPKSVYTILYEMGYALFCAQNSGNHVKRENCALNRNWMAAFLAALLLTTFVGCNKREGGEASGSVPGFQDGEYTASWEDPAGNSGSIKLTVEKGTPTVAEYVPPQGAPASFQETMKQELLEARARSGDTSHYRLPLYSPGTYTVRAEKPEEDYAEYLILTATEDTLTVVEFDGKNKAGELKSADQALSEEMRTAKLYGPNVFLPAIVKNFEEAGSLEKMDGVTGATKSLENFKTLYATAEKNAKFRLAQEETIGQYVDGTYRAEMRDFDHGWKDYVILSIQDNVVTIEEFDAVDEKGQKKSEDKNFQDTMIRANKRAGLPETYPQKYNPEILALFEDAGKNVVAMDNVAGATVSTNHFKLLAGGILSYSARVGDTETLVVDPL